MDTIMGYTRLNTIGKESLDIMFTVIETFTDNITETTEDDYWYGFTDSKTGKTFDINIYMPNDDDPEEVIVFLFDVVDNSTDTDDGETLWHSKDWSLNDCKACIYSNWEKANYKENNP